MQNYINRLQDLKAVKATERCSVSRDKMDRMLNGSCLYSLLKKILSLENRSLIQAEMKNHDSLPFFLDIMYFIDPEPTN